MKRELFGEEISQRTENEFFSATDLVRAGNKWRILNGKEPFNLANYLQNKSTKEFIQELENNFGKVKVNAIGKSSHTWVHPYLFIDRALAINPQLKIEVYGWLFDFLIRNRKESGDSYRKMCGALFVRTKQKATFNANIQKLAKLIQVECGVSDWNKATEQQLKLRDRIHENIALLSEVLNDNMQAIRIGILKAKQ